MRAILAAVVGALLGVAVAVGVVFACTAGVGAPRDIGVALLVGVASLLVGGAAGGVAGYVIFRRRSGR
jgi:hypothetical protein